MSKLSKLFFPGGQNTFLSRKKMLSTSRKTFFDRISYVEVLLLGVAFFTPKTRFQAPLWQISAIWVNNGTKLFLQLESTDKNLSRALLKVKIEQSYEDVVIRLVGPNWYSGSPIRDLEKESQKIDSRSQNPKIWKLGWDMQGIVQRTSKIRPGAGSSTW